MPDKDRVIILTHFYERTQDSLVSEKKHQCIVCLLRLEDIALTSERAVNIIYARKISFMLEKVPFMPAYKTSNSLQ